MPEWDEDSPQLRRNLGQVLSEIAQASQRRKVPATQDARQWHISIMHGLAVPEPRFVGAFRGEPGLERIQVKVGPSYGVSPEAVLKALNAFETKLQSLVAELDRVLSPGLEPDADQLAAIVDLCAWADAEWVRIHPFVNGNGRTARLWANSLAMRYGLPPFVQLRPRPNAGYGQAGLKAMQGDWKPTAVFFGRLLDSFLAASPSALS